MQSCTNAFRKLKIDLLPAEIVHEKLCKIPLNGMAKDSHSKLFANRQAAGFLITYCAFYAAGAAMISMWSCLTLTLDFFQAKYPLYRVSFVFPVINMSTLLLVSIYMILAGRQASIKLRMHTSLISYAIFTMVMVVVNLMHTHRNVAYMWTILALVCSTISSSVLQSSVYGLAGVFGPAFIQAIDGGRGFGAIILFIVRLVVMWLLSNDQERSSRIGMIATFTIAVVFILITWMLYAILSTVSFAQPLFRKYFLVHEESPAESLFSPLPSPLSAHTSMRRLSYDESSLSEKRPLLPGRARIPHVPEGCVAQATFSTSLFGVLNTAYKPFLSVMLSYLICLSCFPGIIVAIPSMTLRLGELFPVISVGCYSIGDLVGKSLPVHWMLLSVETMHWWWILQAGFLLFFVFDYLISFNDLVTIMMVLGFGLITGYVATCSNMIAPTLCSGHQKEIAGMVRALCSIFGLCIGSYCGLALLTILQLIQLLRSA
uniref:Equilibrative Nucleoside Transporter (ENT) family p n=1 Tax=Albugo laibachii Nc14 TaxID=890382 RepID=F0W0T4_9STRA|nr:equilibrative Nucleoside Transporter (ENT) family p [Albugo laibachii Nc14]|eukprot:CCA14658.1 equilibrative Nucleoside Transporter (ENT) family p [Albugo laibachii Nc14]